MRLGRKIGLVAGALMCVGLMCGVASAAKIKVLIVDGQNNHRWQETTPIITESLTGTGLFDVDVATSPPRGKPMDGFSPDWPKYDVVVSNYNGADWPEKTRKAFEKYMAEGGGLVVIHAADNAFSKWDAWNEMIGLGGWGGRNEKSGPYVYFKDGKWIRDTSPGGGGHHGRQTPYEVVTVDPDHPIMKGLPSSWLHVKDELYCKLRGPAKNMTILASSLSDSKTGGSGRTEPVLMALTYGKGRIFHTVLGHGADQCKGVGFIVTLQRGTEWAATGKVTQDTIPSDFPTPGKTSIREKNFGTDPNPDKATKIEAAAAATPIDYAAMVGYEAGTSREAFTNCERQMRGGSPAKLAEIEAGLLTVLENPKATFDAKQYVCRLLRRGGSDACVPALTKLLTDEKLGHMARFALTYLPGDKASAALRDDLAKAKGDMLISAIDSVAKRGDRKAVAIIAKYATGDDKALASVAIAALGEIGGPEAATILGSVKLTEYNSRIWANAYLQVADSLAAEGKTADATAIYEKMYKSGPDTMARVAALGGLARTGGAKAVPTLLAALKDDNAEIQRAAVKFMMIATGEGVGKAMANALNSLSPGAQALVIGALADRGDKAAAETVARCLASEEETVRLAAIRALGAIGDASCVPALVKQLGTAGEAYNAARDSLIKLSDKDAGPAIVKLLSGDTKPGLKAELIGVLVRRRDAGAMKAYLQAANSEDRSVAGAAITALGTLGTPAEAPKVIDMVAAAKDAGRQDQLAQALGSIVSRAADKSGPARLVIAAIAESGGSAKAALISVLPRVGGDKALAEARKQLGSDDVEIRKAAIRALGDWPSVAAVKDLLAAARARTGAENVLAIRGVISVVRKDKDINAADGVSVLAGALGLAKRVDEKRAILAALPSVACPEAVKLAESLAADDALAKDAAAAVKNINNAIRKKKRRRR